jgi:hypothetical protein
LKSTLRDKLQIEISQLENKKRFSVIETQNEMRDRERVIHWLSKLVTNDRVLSYIETEYKLS